MKNLKVGYAITFHYSKHIRPNGKKVLSQNLSSFYESCDYDFDCFLVDNQSEPKNSINDVINFNDKKWHNLHHTYVENQFEKGITGAWDLSVQNAIKSKCEIILLTTDDTICDYTINNLIKHINDDEERDNTLYVPLANGWGIPSIQNKSEPTNEIIEIKHMSESNYLSGAMFAFTNKFFDKYKNSKGELFTADHKYNGGDGKWGGQEGLIIDWFEKGARVVVVGTSLIKHPGKPGESEGTRLSYRTIRYIANGDMDKVISHYTSIGDNERVKALIKEKDRLVNTSKKDMGVN